MNAKQANIISIIISSLGILLAIYFFNASINEKLTFLIDRESGTLTKEQAFDLTELYLDSIQTEMHSGIVDFFEKEYPKAIKSQNDNIFKRFTNKSADEIINRARNKVSRFNLPGEKSFKEFLDEASPTQSGEILKAKDEILHMLISSMVNKTALPKTKSAVLNVVELTGKRAKYVIQNQISTMY